MAIVATSVSPILNIGIILIIKPVSAFVSVSVWQYRKGSGIGMIISIRIDKVSMCDLGSGINLLNIAGYD